jgi:hypothetical protein
MELWNSPKYYFKDLSLNSEGNREAASFTAAQLIKIIAKSREPVSKHTAETEPDIYGKRTGAVHTELY